MGLTLLSVKGIDREGPGTILPISVDREFSKCKALASTGTGSPASPTFPLESDPILRPDNTHTHVVLFTGLPTYLYTRYHNLPLAVLEILFSCHTGTSRIKPLEEEYTVDT